MFRLQAVRRPVAAHRPLMSTSLIEEMKGLADPSPWRRYNAVIEIRQASAPETGRDHGPVRQQRNCHRVTFAECELQCRFVAVQFVIFSS